MTTAQQVDQRVEAVTGRRVAAVERIGGGDIGQAWKVDTDAGPLFAKTHRHPPPTLFATEAAGLRWLAEPAALPVPAVVAAEPDLLLLDWVEPGPPGDGAVLGHGLAALHRAGAPAFGAPAGGSQAVGFVGDVQVPDGPTPDRVTFLLERRWRPLAWKALAEEVVDPELERVLDAVADGLDERLGPGEPPARVHGDLWSGNVHWGADGRPWLADPAAHGGFRETDLAMLDLFGGLPDATLGAYQDAFPLPEGWRGRVRLHQVTPLLVHAVLFGGAYGRQALDALRTAL
jgi:fructosamine-3-kinase